MKLFRAGGWADKPLIQELLSVAPESQISLLNDAEAHLVSHTDIFTNPCMSISLGTSLGFAISDRNGAILRPPDNVNFDIGEIAIPTRASNNTVWWALGSKALTELERDLGEEKGKAQFGYRLGAFLAGLASIFRPTTIVLSGGITSSSWHLFGPAMQSEFTQQKPDWLQTPEIVRSPFSRRAALIGAAKYASAETR